MYQFYISKVLTFMEDDFLPKVLIQMNIPMQEEWQKFVTEKFQNLELENLKNTIEIADPNH